MADHKSSILTATHGRCSTLLLSREHSRVLLGYLPHLSPGDPRSSLVTPLVGGGGTCLMWGDYLHPWRRRTCSCHGDRSPTLEVVEFELPNVGWIIRQIVVYLKRELCWERVGSFL